MSRLDYIGEIAAGVSICVVTILALFFGHAVMPYQPSMHSEATYASAGHE